MEVRECKKHGHYQDDNCPGCLKDAAPALLAACKNLLAFQDTDSIFRLPANIPEISDMRQAIAEAESL